MLLCLLQVTPIMYSSELTKTETTNSGGLTHDFPLSDIEHLSGNNNSRKTKSDINLNRSQLHLIIEVYFLYSENNDLI